MGFFPIGDFIGYEHTVEMMLHSLNIGRNVMNCVIINTVTKQRSDFSGIQRSSAVRQSNRKIISGNIFRKITILACPAYTLWQENFVKGFERFMERLTILDLALDMKIMVVIINNLKTDWNHEKDLQARRRIIFF